MCVCFCAGVAIVGCQLFRFLRCRWPCLSSVALFTIIWAMPSSSTSAENVIIGTTHAYAFAKTYKPLTIMAGATNQFPLYESVSSDAGVSIHVDARAGVEDPEELGPVERGYKRWAGLGGAVRSFAVIGFYAASCILCYYLPLNWLGAIGTSEGYLPDYLRPGRVGHEG